MSFLPVTLMLRQRPPCAVCAKPCDYEQTSAHFAGVWRFCTECGKAFHAPEQLAAVREAGDVGRREGTGGTLAMWKHIERWIVSHRQHLNSLPPSELPATSPAPPSDDSQASPPASSSPSDGGGSRALFEREVRAGLRCEHARRWEDDCVSCVRGGAA